MKNARNILVCSMIVLAGVLTWTGASEGHNVTRQQVKEVVRDAGPSSPQWGRKMFDRLLLKAKRHNARHRAAAKRKRRHRRLKRCRSVSGSVMVARVCRAHIIAAASDRSIPMSWVWSWHLHDLLKKESGARPWAVNPSSGACGLYQRLPCPWDSVGLHNAVEQSHNGMRYVKVRYGSPAAAWIFWQRNHWY